MTETVSLHAVLSRGDRMVLVHIPEHSEVLMNIKRRTVRGIVLETKPAHDRDCFRCCFFLMDHGDAMANCGCKGIA